MKFTLSWLKDHLDTSAPLEKISDTLTMLGLEVESVTDRGAELKPFTVAKILAAEKHPEADKLRVCKVQSDIGELQIVCGAANARSGIYVALAKEGAVIPHGGMVIKKTKIRGVESFGMLCSAEELDIEGDSEGIIELPEAKIGESIVGVLGLDDPVIDVAITPNRADCLSVRGIARDLAAAGIGNLLPLEGGGSRWGSNGNQTPTRPAADLPLPGGGKSPISVTLATPACRQFIGAYVKGAKNSPSPDWMRKRLSAIGQKPISALVDITNYFTIDLGRPLHVYDAKKLKGNITVREAKDGEKLAALDKKEYALKSGMCVIADESGPVALGGIIGGQASACGLDTDEVFLEVAYFDPPAVAGTGRALQIDSDARYRFERGVDPGFVEPGARLALAMIQKLCGGEASELVIAGKTPEWKREIAFNPDRVKSLGGIEISEITIQSNLQKLGFVIASAAKQSSSAASAAQKKLTAPMALSLDCFVANAPRNDENMWTVDPPSWRADVEGEADLVEEVLRIHGYDHIPPTPMPKLPGVGRSLLNAAQKRVQSARRALAARGMLECRTWSFLPEAQAKLFGGGDEKLKLLNPISADLSDMRPSLLPNLLEAAKRNAARGMKDLALCEIGLQFHDVTPDSQRMAAAGIRAGRHTYYVHGEQFQECRPPLDAFDAKTDALALLQQLGLSKADITTDTPPWYHPGRSGALTLGGKIVLGYFGEIHPGLLPKFDLDGPVAAFEIFLDAIPLPRARGKARPPLKTSDYPAVERDFAFTVDAKITAAEIEKAIRAAEKNLVTDVSIFDVYSGKGVEPGKKSVALRVTLQSFERTLTEQDITAVSNAVVAAAGKFGGVLRQ